MHYLYVVTGMLLSTRLTLDEMVRFEVDYTFWLNLAFGVIAAIVLVLHSRTRKGRHERTERRMQPSRANKRHPHDRTGQSKGKCNRHGGPYLVDGYSRL